MAYFIEIEEMDTSRKLILNLVHVSHVRKHDAVAACITMSNGNIIFSRYYKDVIKEINIKNKELS